MSDQIELVTGRAHTFTLTVTDRDSGLPVHIDGEELFFAIKRSVRNADSDVVLRKAVGSGITILDSGAEDANKGRARIEIVAADWAGFDPRGQTDYPWELIEVVSDEPTTIMGTPVGDAPIRLQQGVLASVP